MAAPIDSALLATQTYKPRKPAAGARTRTEVFQEDRPSTAPAVVSRRTQSGVAVSLSAEALQLLNGSDGAGERAREKVAERSTPESEPASATASDAFTLEDGAPSPQREAPFAHLSRDGSYRPAAPGSRLDISV